MRNVIYKAGFILLIGLIASLGLGYLKNENDKNANRFYKQGMTFYEQGKYSDAFYNFKQIKRYNSLYILSLLKEYQCANKLADKKTAHIKLVQLAKILKDENIRPYVLYNETILSFDLKLTTKEQTYKKFRYIHEKYPKNDFAIASAFKAAQLIEDKDKNYAKDRYIEYLSYAPSGKFSQVALDSLSKTDVFISKEDWKTIALSYLANSKYSEAIQAFKNAEFDNNWYDISKCYKGLNDSINEKAIISKGLSLKESKVSEKDISNAIDRLATISKSDKNLILQDLFNKSTDSYIFPTVAYKLAEISPAIRAIKLYELVVEKYSDSIWASNSLWEVFWYNYNLKRYKTCEKLARKHMAQYYNSQDAPRVMYWYARVLLHERRNLQARDTLYKVINEYPLSYYAFLSARQLKISKAKQMVVKKQIVKYSIDSLNKYLFSDKALLFLAQNDDFETIDDLKINDEYIKSWVAYKMGNYPKSINIAKNQFNKNINPESILNGDIDEEQKVKVSFSDFQLKLMYPILYKDTINDYASYFGQSPYLFMSLIREESHFDKFAKSSVGATGLTQLMSSTADFIEKKKVTKDILLNEKENIRIGVKYFDYLVKYFDNNEYLAILAYNAGPGNIKKWKNNPMIESDEIDVFVENIPFLETKNYIKKILSSYWIYLNIYSPKNIK